MELLENVHKVQGVNANVYLILDGEELTLVDTGMPRSAKKILDYVYKIGHEPSEITRIVLTHCHLDHAGSAQKLKELTDAKVAVHREEAESVAGRKPLPSPKGAVGILFKALSSLFKPMPVEPDIVLNEGDRVGKLMIIHTPGPYAWKHLIVRF